MIRQPMNNTTLIEIEKIRPNAYNPNEMSEQQMDELRAEVEHLGELPQPIIVRPIDGRYEIVDGEHRYTIAIEKCWTHVPCRLMEIDDFEARRRTYKFNRGGQDNPVLLGWMFREMLGEDATRISIRELSRRINVPEATIRQYLKYAKAAELRCRCAPETADDDIAALSQDQLRMYMDLPESIRDRWLDAGADMDTVADVGDWKRDRVADAIHRHELADYLPADSAWSFGEDFERIGRICQWCEQHRVDDIVGYLPPMAEHGLPTDVLDLLPLEQLDRSCRVLIPVEAWAAAIQRAADRGGDRTGTMAMVGSAVRVALREAGYDPAEVCDPRVAEALQVIAEGPDYIGEAEHLSLPEQRYLVEFDVGLDDDTNAELKRHVVAILYEHRAAQPRKKRKKKTAKMSVQEALRHCLDELRQQLVQGDDPYADPEQLFADVVERLMTTEAIQQVVIADRLAADVLHERLDRMEWPEFFLLAPAILETDDVESLAATWLSSIQDIASEEDDA